jgi:hypothetical protein
MSQGFDLFAERFQLMKLVLDRPEHDAVYAHRLVGGELLGALVGGADHEALSQLLAGAPERRSEDIPADAIDLGAIFGDVEEHGREGVGESVGVLAEARRYSPSRARTSANASGVVL